MISSITEVLLQQVLRDGSSCFLQQHAEPSLAFVSFIYPVSSPRDTSCAHGDRKQRQKLGQLLQMSLYCLIPVMCWGKATDPVQRRHPEKGGPRSPEPCYVTGGALVASYIITSFIPSVTLWCQCHWSRIWLLYPDIKCHLRDSFGWGRKEQLYFFVRQRGPRSS